MTATRMVFPETSEVVDGAHPPVPAAPFDSAPASSEEVVALERHYYEGIKYFPGQTYAMAAEAVARNVALGLVFRPHREPTDWWGHAGRLLQAEPGTAKVLRRKATPGALRILAGVAYDPGCAAYRFHTALNETTRHTSAFVRWEDRNPHCSLRQYDGYKDVLTVRQLMLEADVVHCHVDYLPIGETKLQPRMDQVLVRHYHGSRPDGRSWVEQDLDDQNGAIQVGARLSHLGQSDRLHWLPIPMPVRRYRAMRGSRWTGEGVLRIAHSPTRRSYKGTHDFWHVCENLRARGLPIEPVLIEDKTHAEALAIKATCHAVFDSFWLGLQGSGLEGGAMQMPVIAGDADVRDLHIAHVGACPYTFAGDAAELAAVIERLALDFAFYEAERDRIAAYVETYHDYAAVGRRYEAILTAERPALMARAA